FPPLTRHSSFFLLTYYNLLTFFWVIFTCYFCILFFRDTLKFYISFDLSICVAISIIRIFDVIDSWKHTRLPLSFLLALVIFELVTLLMFQCVYLSQHHLIKFVLPVFVYFLVGMNFLLLAFEYQPS